MASSTPPAKRARINIKNGGGASSSSTASTDAKNKQAPSSKVKFAEPAPRGTTKKTSDDCHDALDPITPAVLGERSVNDLTGAYRDAKPYPHGMIRNFCKDGFLEEILTELKHNSKVKFKETDLFRVYQSIDLGNVQDGSDLADKMPALMKLKNAVYSPEYRAFVENIAGLDAGTLTDEVDCAANCHAKGCHLLCHDDVIGTRKVSYIIYLTDAEPAWTDKDGGRLELYEAVAEKGTGRGNVPGALPAKTILPEFNSMAYFVVEPGVSFHSVQEVFCVDRPRLSIQGWYHAKETPEQIENATLQRLKSTGKGEDTEGGFEPLVEASADGSKHAESSIENGDGKNQTIDLSEEDRCFLGKYINAAYLSKESMDEIQNRFEEESSVKLRHFLLDEWNAKINGAFAKEDARDELGNDRPSLDYHVGTDDNWKAIGPAHKQRFLEYQSSSKDQSIDAINDDPNLGAGDYLHHLQKTVLQSPAFGRWLGWISSLGFPLGQRGRIRRFRPGLDYTVAHYGVLTTNAVLDATLCFCAGEGKQCSVDEETQELMGCDDDYVWESGDVGGFECYIAAEEGGEEDGPDAEYDDEDDTKLLSVSASNNTLSLVYRDPGTMRFVKYVSAGAPSSRWDIALEYDVEADDSDDEEEDDGEEE